MALPQGTMSFAQIGCFGLGKNATFRFLVCAEASPAANPIPPAMAISSEAAVSRAAYGPLFPNMVILPLFGSIKGKANRHIPLRSRKIR